MACLGRDGKSFAAWCSSYIIQSVPAILTASLQPGELTEISAATYLFGTQAVVLRMRTAFICL